MTRRAPPAGKMYGDICGNCMRPHGGDPCSHNPDARCTTCDHPVGFLWSDTPTSVCWFCATCSPRPTPRTEPMRPPDDDVWM